MLRGSSSAACRVARLYLCLSCASLVHTAPEGSETPDLSQLTSRISSLAAQLSSLRDQLQLLRADDSRRDSLRARANDRTSTTTREREHHHSRAHVPTAPPPAPSPPPRVHLRQLNDTAIDLSGATWSSRQELPVPLTGLYTRSSARWQGYLRSVYRDDRPPPTDLLWRLGFVYLSAPVDELDCVVGFKTLVSPAACEQLVAVIRQTPGPEVHINWYGYFLLPSWRPTCSSRQPVTFWPDGAWVEVTRISESFFWPHPKSREGFDNGCWFFAAPGSGIFLNAGRSLRATTRAEALEALGMVNDTLGSKNHSLASQMVGYPNAFDYAPFCRRVRALGYDTLQFFEEARFGESHRGHREEAHKRGQTRFYQVEVVSCQRGCFDEPGQNVHHHTCTHLALRTGFDASLPCNCSNRGPMLNCANTQPHIVPPFDAAKWPRGAPAAAAPVLKGFRPGGCSPHTPRINMTQGST